MVILGVTCDKCKKIFKNLYSLRTHLYQTCGKEPTYFCDKCGNMFKNKANLKRHQNSKHAGDFLDELLSNKR